MDDVSTDAAPTGRIVQPPRPLSESMLWSVQSQYFERSGVSAWTSGDVPHALTGGPLAARAYAQVIEGFARDCAQGSLGRFDPDQPMYVIELGAGTGRLGYGVARALASAPLPVKVVYVLTDMARSNLAFWRKNPQLEPLLEAGLVDLAVFDATIEQDLGLELSRVSLAAGSLANPLVVVANYLFDVIPQDLFASVDGVPVEHLVCVVEAKEELDPQDPGFFNKVWLGTTQRQVERGRYADPAVDELLWSVAANRRGDRFLFPASAVSCLERLLVMAGGRMLLLSGERPGSLDPIPPIAPGEAVRAPALLGMGVHGGSFSLPVDMGIVYEALEGHGAHVLLPEASPAGLLISAAVVGAVAHPCHSARSFDLAINQGGPEDVFLTLRSILDDTQQRRQLPLAVVLAALRTGGYDPYLLPKMRDLLTEALRDAPEAGVEEALRVMRKIIDNEYSMDDETDMAVAAAGIFAMSGHFAPAALLLQDSRLRRGPNPRAEYNEALCRLRLDDAEGALALLEEALGIDPTLEHVKDLRQRVIEELGQMPQGSS